MQRLFYGLHKIYGYVKKEKKEKKKEKKEEEKRKEKALA